MISKFFTESFHKRKMIWLIPILGSIYLLLFNLLEAEISSPGSYHVIHCPLDRLIPFCEYFIVFYLSWFLFVAMAFGYVILFEKNAEYCNRFILYIFAGMYIFLLISWIYPNGLHIRPISMPHDNLFTALCQMVYRRDTSTNVFPSIHCFNSVAIYLAAKNNPAFRKRHWVVDICKIWTILIILSTMFVKQHSVYDVIGGIVMGYALYAFHFQTAKAYAHAYAKVSISTHTFL